MPLVSRTFDQLIDFTRTTSGTFVGSNGFIQSTPQSPNLLTFTQEFDNSNWAKTNATVTANSTTAPDGTGTADKFLDNTTLAQHFTAQQFASVSAGTTYAASVYLKRAELGFAFFGLGGGAFSAPPFISVNLSTGAVSTTNGSPSNVTATNAGDGWWRVSLTATTDSTGTVTFDVRTSQDGVWANRAYAGTGQGIFIWGAQAETGSTATTYTRNYGGLYPPRFDYDPVTLAPKGLLIEEQRSNLLLRSEEFDSAIWIKSEVTVTANSTVSPSGATNADSIIETTTNAIHRIAQQLTATNAVAHAYTVYARAIGSRRLYVNCVALLGSSALFDLTGAGSVVATGGAAANRAASIAAVGGGWYRCTVIGTGTGVLANTFNQINQSSSSTATDDTYTGDGTSGLILWGAQLEAGSFATSYIPTVASQVTRTADQAAINAPNFAPWYNSTQGTFAAEFSFIYTGAGASSAGILNFDESGNKLVAYVALSGTTVNSFDGSTVVSGYAVTGGGIQKAASAYDLSGRAITANGNTVITGAVSATYSASSSLQIGGGIAIGAINGHIRSIRYYPTRLTNAQLQALTA